MRRAYPPRRRSARSRGGGRLRSLLGRRGRGLGALLSLLGAAPACAAISCSVTSSGVAFGHYEVTQTTATTARARCG